VFTRQSGGPTRSATISRKFENGGGDCKNINVGTKVEPFLDSYQAL